VSKTNNEEYVGWKTRDWNLDSNLRGLIWSRNKK
jgi:hypothetical protein